MNRRISSGLVDMIVAQRSKIKIGGTSIRGRLRTAVLAESSWLVLITVEVFGMITANGPKR